MSVNIKKLFKYYIFFALFYGSYKFFYPIKGSFKSLAPPFFFVLKDIVSITMSIFFWFYFILNYKTIIFKKRVILSYFAFSIIYILITCSHLIHKAPIYVIQHNIRNIYFYSTFILYMSILTSDELLKYLILIIRLGYVVIIIGILSFIFKFTVVQGRVLSTMMNANNLGLFGNFLIIMNIYIFFYNKRFRYLLYNIPIILVIFMSGSFQSIFLLAIIVSIFLFYYFRKRKVLKYYFLLFIMGIFLFSYSVKLRYFVLNRYHAIFVSKTSTSYVGRIEGNLEYLNFVRTTRWYNFLFGDFTIDKYFKYDSQHLNILRNDGLVSYLDFTIMLIFLLYFGMKKTRKFKKYKETVFLKGVIIYIIISWYIIFFFTAFLNRYPLNFLYYFLVGFIVYFKPEHISVEMRRKYIK